MLGKCTEQRLNRVSNSKEKLKDKDSGKYHVSCNVLLMNLIKFSEHGFLLLPKNSKITHCRHAVSSLF